MKKEETYDITRMQGYGKIRKILKDKGISIDDCTILSYGQNHIYIKKYNKFLSVSLSFSIFDDKERYAIGVFGRNRNRKKLPNNGELITERTKDYTIKSGWEACCKAIGLS